MIGISNRRDQRRLFKEDLQGGLLRDSSNRKSSRKTQFSRDLHYRNNSNNNNEAELEDIQDEEEQQNWFNKRIAVGYIFFKFIFNT